MKVIEIKQISEFLGEIEELRQSSEIHIDNSDLIFRGQSTDEKLLPRLARVDLRGDIRKIEKLMIEEFRRSSLPFTEFKTETLWDTLALAQHHGLPTRLLDWSYSAMAALWFAVRKPFDQNKSAKSGVLWILSLQLDDFHLELPEESRLEIRTLKIFRPKYVSSRIPAQSGVFTAHPLRGEKFTPLEEDADFEKKLFKMIIQTESFSEIRRFLQVCSVNYGSLFPDLDGLCKQIEWKYCRLHDEPN